MLCGLDLLLSAWTGICQQSQYWAVRSWMTGADLEIINPFMKARQRKWDKVLPRSFLLTLCSILEYLSRAIQQRSHRDRWKVRKGIVVAVVHENSLLNIRKTCPFVCVNMWRKTWRRAAVFHPVVSQTQTSYRNLSRLSLCSASSSPVAFLKPSFSSLSCSQTGD